jgi:antitoxin (DNA-binding transcriptional repressor) of toxin-antitoxin stability system
MKHTSLAEFRAHPDRFIEDAQGEDVVVTDDGEPVALVLGIRFKDQEDLDYENDPAFWEMIRRRRAEVSIPWEQVEAELFPEKP